MREIACVHDQLDWLESPDLPSILEVSIDEVAFLGADAEELGAAMKTIDAAAEQLVRRGFTVTRSRNAFSRKVVWRFERPGIAYPRPASPPREDLHAHVIPKRVA